MADVTARELRSNASDLLRGARAGETITITVDGRPVAMLTAIEDKPRWMPREEFVGRVLRHQADVGLRADLARITPDSTDDLA